MLSVNIRQIKAAIRDQAFRGTAHVCCPIGVVVSVRRLLALIRGWGGRWYPGECVRIEYTGHALLP